MNARLLPRVRPVFFVTLAGLWGLCTALEAASPQIKNVAPLGVQRGSAAGVTISGANLAGHPRLLAHFGFKINSPRAGQPTPKSDASTFAIDLVVAPETAVGVYPVRVQTDDGVSNPFLLAVGQLPQVGEKEDNSEFESAQLLPTVPVVVEGQAAGNDVDFFRFHGKAGQIIVVDAQCARIGSGIDPTIRLTTAAPRRAYVASADDSPGLLTDARLSAVLPEDGDYVVELSDSRYQGGGRPVYRLVIGEVPMAEEVFPLGGRQGETVGLELRGGTFSAVKVAAATLRPMSGTDLFWPQLSATMLGPAPARPPLLDVESLGALICSTYPELREPADPAAPPLRAAAPVVLNGRIDPPGDDDRFTIVTTPGERLRVRVQASELGSALDGVVRVLGKGAAVIANADDTTINIPVRPGQQAQSIVLPDPSAEFTIPGGTSEITLAIRDLENRGGVGFPYRIVVEPILPDFELQVNDPEVSVPRGGVAAVGVTVVRKGYSGPIDLTVSDPPPGLSARSGTIAAGQTAGVLSLSAAANAAFPAAPVKLVGRGQGSDGPFERLAFKPIVYAQQGNLPTCSITEYGLLAAPALATPATLETPSAPVEVPHGFSAKIPIKVVRTEGALGALEVSPLPLPPGLTIAKATIAEKATEGAVTVAAALAAPKATFSLGLQAKGKLAGAERTIAAPVVTVTVVAPASLEMSAPSAEVKPGATVEVKGKIVRKGAFDAPVTVKASGLPPGLKAEPVTVAKGAAEFVLKIAADAKASPATASAQIALAYQVEKKDYPSPPTPLAVKVVPIK